MLLEILYFYKLPIRWPAASLKLLSWYSFVVSWKFSIFFRTARTVLPTNTHTHKFRTDVLNDWSPVYDVFILKFRNFQEQILLFPNKLRHGIIPPQNDKRNHCTGTGCDIYSQLMAKIPQILFIAVALAFFLKPLKTSHTLPNCLPLKINLQSRIFENDDSINQRG